MVMSYVMIINFYSDKKFLDYAMCKNGVVSLIWRSYTQFDLNHSKFDIGSLIAPNFLIVPNDTEMIHINPH